MEEYETNNEIPVVEEPTKKSNKKLIIAVVVVVVALVGVGVFLSTRKSPLEKLSEGAEQMISSVRPGIGDYLGSKELVKFTETGVYEQNFQLTLDEVTSADEYTDMSMFNGAEIGSDIGLDTANKKMDSNWYISYGGEKLIDANIFANNTTLSIAMPDFFEGYVAAETANFGTDFNKSALAQLMQMELSDTDSFPLFPEDGVDVVGVFDFMDSVKKSIGGIEEKIIVEKTKVKEDIEIGGDMQSCDVYSMFLPKVYLEAVMKTYIDYMKSIGYQQETMTFLIEELEKIEYTDVTAFLYLDKTGRLVKIMMDLDYIIDGENLNAVASIVTHGKEYLWDDVDASIVYKFGEGSETLDFAWKKATIADGGVATAKHTITLTDETTNVVIEGETSFNAETGELLVKAGIIPEDGGLENISLDFKGKFSEVVKGSGFTLDITDLVLTSDGDTNSASLSGIYSLAPLVREIKDPEGTGRNILTMSESDLMSFAMESMLKFQTSPLGQLVGGLGGLY